jgi:hypothetical protein
LSILGYASCASRLAREQPSWEVLFEVGQGVLPFLIEQGYRPPDAVLLSHPHFDHVSGLDWLGASWRRWLERNRRHHARLPVFTTWECWRDIINRFPWFGGDLALQQLYLRQTTPFHVDPRLFVTAFPVYHGPYAPGACLMLLEYAGEKAILSGDLLCPLMTKNDYDKLRGAKIAYVDANTRFPCPNSNHWSIIEIGIGAAALNQFVANCGIVTLLAPHAGAAQLPATINLRHDLCWSINEFLLRLAPCNVALVHYSGYEDMSGYGQPILTDTDLGIWASSILNSSAWQIPTPGREFVLYDGP